MAHSNSLNDIALTWTPDARVGAPDAGGSLRSALEEQLGVTFERSKGPVDVLVVDAAERPSAD